MEIFIVILFIVGISFLMFMQTRRQKRQLDEIKSVQSQLSPGELVITAAGTHGLVREVRENEVDLEIAPGIVTTWEKMAIVRRVEDARSASDDVDPQTGGAEEPRSAEPFDDPQDRA